MIEPTREQEAKIDQLANHYASVQVRVYGTPDAPHCYVLCWQQRPSGAYYLVDDVMVYADGRERVLR